MDMIIIQEALIFYKVVQNTKKYSSMVQNLISIENKYTDHIKYYLNT